jgi:nicotinate-nucleotide adenylyltransferase|tara:strand:+ start:61 stop:699 length:639 start_codon:yes stop_codon:yes gene_type:complete
MIGVLGGSFDPIHFGHIKPLNELSSIFDFTEIRLIPTYQSPVNKSFHANASHRHNMTSIIASSSLNNFVSDDLEIKKEGVSYTYDTIKIIKKETNNEDLCLIMGLDVFLNIESWYNYLEILKEVNIIVINRPESNVKKIENMNFEVLDRITSNKIDFLKNQKKQIFFHQISSLNISSTKIRDIIRSGGIPTGLIPGTIMSYIKRNNLYMEKI